MPVAHLPVVLEVNGVIGLHATHQGGRREFHVLVHCPVDGDVEPRAAAFRVAVAH